MTLREVYLMDSIHQLPVIFHSEGVPLIGRFFRAGADWTVRQAGVVVTGSWLTVKEQMPTVYALRLAALGYTAFVFDFAGFGQSQGMPRQCEMPLRKIADIKAAAEFLSTQSFIQTGRVGHLAICASAQYTLAALAEGAKIASFAGVAGWFHDAASVAPFYGGTEGVGTRLARAAAASEQFARTGELSIVPAYEAGNERAGMILPLDYYAKTERGAVAAWKNEMSEMSWFYWLNFDGLSAADSVHTPALFVHGDGCVLPDHVRQIHQRLKGTKKLVWTDGSQVDFYDQPELVSKAMDQVGPWFNATLRA